MQQRLTVLQGEVATWETKLETSQTEFREVEAKKEVAARELRTSQVEYCSLQEKLSEIQVAISRLRGNQQASNQLFSCPLSQQTE